MYCTQTDFIDEPGPGNFKLHLAPVSGSEEENFVAVNLVVRYTDIVSFIVRSLKY